MRLNLLLDVEHEQKEITGTPAAALLLEAKLVAEFMAGQEDLGLLNATKML